MGCLRAKCVQFDVWNVWANRILVLHFASRKPHGEIAHHGQGGTLPGEGAAARTSIVRRFPWIVRRFPLIVRICSIIVGRFPPRKGAPNYRRHCFIAQWCAMVSRHFRAPGPGRCFFSYTQHDDIIRLMYVAWHTFMYCSFRATSGVTFERLGKSDSSNSLDPPHGAFHSFRRRHPCELFTMAVGSKLVRKPWSASENPEQPSNTWGKATNSWL